MTSFLLVFMPSCEGIGTEAALMELRALATESAFILDGPFELEGPVASADPARFMKAAEILERAARSRKIGEGLARAKAEGRRIGRPPVAQPVTAMQIVLDRASGRSWRSIEAEYRIPMTSARRLCQKELRRQIAHQSSRQEAEHP